MKRFLLNLILLLPSLVAAQTVVHTAGREIPNTFTAPNQFTQGTQLGPTTVATLPGNPAVGQLINITDGSVPGDCTVGGGTSFNLCGWNGFAWVNPVSSGSLGVFTSVTTGTLTTTGPGWTKTVQCQTPPANPSAGSITFYCDSGTGQFTAINSTGASANPGGATWGTVTSGTNSNTGSFIASGNTWNFNASTLFLLRVGSACTTTVVGDLCYDNGNPKMWHIWQNGADNFLITALASGTYTNGDCTSISKTGNIITFVDSGGACGAAGTASVLEFGCGGTISATVTDFCGIGNVATSEGGTQVPMPRAGTFGNMQCHIGGAGLSSSQTIVITFRKNGVSQTSTCTLNSGSPNNCSDGTHTFAVVAGDLLDFQTVPSNSPTVGAVNCTGTY